MDTDRAWESKLSDAEGKQTNYKKLISAICRNVGTPRQLDITATQ